MIAKLLVGLAAVSIFATLGCQKNTDFYYLRNDPPPTVISKYTKIKDISFDDGLDLIWVIDNSGSMQSHQQNVINNTEKFMKVFRNNGFLKWKIGLLSTDTADRPYLGFARGDEFDYTSSDPVPRFQDAVNALGISGSATEKTFEPIIQALEDPSNPKFLRPKSILGIILVSDAPEQSRYGAAQFLSLLSKSKPNLQQVFFYPVIAPLDWCGRGQEDPFYYPGSPYELVVKGTGGGHPIPLCTPDFGAELANIGNDLVKRVAQPKIFLEERARTGSVHVIYKGKEVPGGPRDAGGMWYYDYGNNAVVFYDLDFAPEEKEEIQIIYEKDIGL